MGALSSCSKVKASSENSPDDLIGEVEANSASVEYAFRVGFIADDDSLPLSHLIDYPPEIEGLSVSFERFSSYATEIQHLLRGELDIGFLPVQAAAKVFEKADGAVVSLGEVTEAAFFLLSDEADYSGLESLKGKTVAVVSGGISELLFCSLLQKEGIAVSIAGDSSEETAAPSDSVILDFSIPNAEIASQLIAGKVHYAVLTEPFASIAEERSLNRLVRRENLHEMLVDPKGTLVSYPELLMVARSEFASEKGERISAFTKFYEEAVEWAFSHPLEVYASVQKNELYDSALTVKYLPFKRFVWRDSTTSRSDIERSLSVFMQFDSSRELTLPKDDFYWN